MAVQFFRLIIKGTNKTKLETIKNWIDTRIENNDLDDKIGGGEVTVKRDINNEESETYTLKLDMYLKSTVNKTKYKDIIVTQFTGLNKKGLTQAYIDKYDECSHDSDNPKPCILTRVLEWTA